MNHKLQSIASVGIIGLALAVPAVFGQTTSGQDGSGQQSGSQQGRHKGGGHRGFHRGMMGMQALNLTDAQKAQAKQIRESHRATMGPLMEQLRATNKQLRQAEQNGTFNEALATQTLTQEAGVKAKLMAERFQIRQQMLALLTPEQKAKLDQMRTEWKAKRAERRAPQA